MRGDDALAEVAVALLGKRLKKAKQHVAGAAKGDPDGVHDLRVAIRKLRAASSVLRETIVDPDAFRGAEKRLKTLFGALGAVRDHDVMVARVTTMAKRRDVSAKALDRLLGELKRDGKRLAKDLRDVMRSDDPEDLFDHFGRVVTRAIDRAQRDADDHRVLVRHYASSVLLRRYETVLAYEIVLPAPLDVMHRLRIAIKKLRYALDFFGDALGDGATALDDALQKAQDQLGDLHDHHVARARLAEIERRRGARAPLEEVRAADDEDAERLLTSFDETWTQVARGAIATAMLRACATLLGPAAASPSKLALRRAEPAAPPL